MTLKQWQVVVARDSSGIPRDWPGRTYHTKRAALLAALGVQKELGIHSTVEVRKVIGKSYPETRA